MSTTPDLLQTIALIDKKLEDTHSEELLNARAQLLTIYKNLVERKETLTREWHNKLLNFDKNFFGYLQDIIISNNILEANLKISRNGKPAKKRVRCDNIKVIDSSATIKLDHYYSFFSLTHGWIAIRVEEETRYGVLCSNDELEQRFVVEREKIIDQHWMRPNSMTLGRP